VLLPTLTPILTPHPAAGILFFFRIWLSGEVAAYLAVAGLLPPPENSAVTPPLSAHHVVDIPKLTECSTSLQITTIQLFPDKSKMCKLKQKEIYKYTHSDPPPHQVIVHHDDDMQSQQNIISHISLSILH